MGRKILCIAPHPDDETLGCGGTLLAHRANGDEIHWLIVTAISTEAGFTAERVAQREAEISAASQAYGFAGLHRCDFPTMRLDTVPMAELVDSIGAIVHQVAPDILLLPYRGDAHSDHTVVFDAAAACTKSFRYPSVKGVYAYETLSETEFGLRPDDGGFRPNLFINIADHLDAKIAIMRLFASELGEFPFPRSETAIRAQAQLRGLQAGSAAAEAFVILREIR